jgi:tripartite-type tricarboxylate transporter receptor subunit TctC
VRTLHRRRLLHLTAGAAALPAFAPFARAQAYPSRPVRIVAGFSSGSAMDTIARLMGQWLTEKVGQSFIIENRGGAGGNLGTEAVVRSPPDGYTLLIGGSPDAINATLYDKLSFNFLRDTTPVAAISRGPNVLVVHPSFPAKTFPEFIAYTKANPGRVDFASAGVGSVSHMAGELFMAMTGAKLVHVPYRGLAPAVTDLLGGQVKTIFATMPPAIENIRAGNLRALAVTSATRSNALPDLPTVADFLPGYEATLLSGLVAPRNTPADVVERINREVNVALADPGMKARLAVLGNDPVSMTSAEFGKLLAEETEKWAKVIRTANLKPE